MTIIHATIKLCLPKIRSKLLEHNLNRQVDDTVTDSSRRGIVGRKTRFNEGGTMRLKKLEQIRRTDKGELEDLAESIGNIAPILRDDEGRVEKTGTRRIEGPNAVLVSFVRDTAAVINSILHSHTGIDNGKERGGHTDKWNATTVQAGRHTGNIKKASTSDCEEGLTTTQLIGTKVVEELINGIWPLVSLSTVEDSRRKLDALLNKVLADLIAIHLVNLSINHGKAAIVALGMDTGGIQHLGIGRIQQRSVGDHVHIVRDGEGEDIAPPPSSGDRLGRGDDGSRRLLLHGHLLLGGGLFEFEDILRSPFQGAEGDLGAGHFTFLLPFAEVDGSVAAASSLTGRCAAGPTADSAVRGTARGGKGDGATGNLGRYQSGTNGFGEGRPRIQNRRRETGPDSHVGF
mmetsp:Transcript_32626/g.96161  ORF Transcript_32626/g.96161 Transcript_32626/m.96161 type:complete len:402 (+) Transcript_32626:1439-2644(+)